MNKGQIHWEIENFLGVLLMQSIQMTNWGEKLGILVNLETWLQEKIYEIKK